MLLILNPTVSMGMSRVMLSCSNRTDLILASRMSWQYSSNLINSSLTSSRSTP